MHIGFVGERLILMQNYFTIFGRSWDTHELVQTEPDPIEHVWDNLKRAVVARNPVPYDNCETSNCNNTYLLKTLIRSM